MITPDERLDRHMTEWTDYVRSKPQVMDIDEARDLLEGFLHTMGFHPYHEPIYEEDDEIFRFPFLDQYWERAGAVFISFLDASTINTRDLLLKIASCMQVAEKRGELHRLVDATKGNLVPYFAKDL